MHLKSSLSSVCSAHFWQALELVHERQEEAQLRHSLNRVLKYLVSGQVIHLSFLSRSVVGAQERHVLGFKRSHLRQAAVSVHSWQLLLTSE